MPSTYDMLVDGEPLADVMTESDEVAGLWVVPAALFGGVTMERFQKAVHYAELARKYAPPGLLPRESEGPKRARMAGTTVHFVKQTSYPRFLLRRL